MVYVGRVSARIIATALSATASFVGSLAVPVAFPQTPQWIGQAGLCLAVALALIACLFWWLDRQVGKKLHYNYYGGRAADGLMPLQEAARVAYGDIPMRNWIEDKARHQSPWTDSQKALGAYAHEILRHDIPVWGVNPISKKSEQMSKESAASFQISGDAATMFDALEPSIVWADIQIKKADFEHRLMEMRRQFRY